MSWLADADPFDHAVDSVLFYFLVAPRGVLLTVKIWFFGCHTFSPILNLFNSNHLGLGFSISWDFTLRSSTFA